MSREWLPQLTNSFYIIIESQTWYRELWIYSWRLEVSSTRYFYRHYNESTSRLFMRFIITRSMPVKLFRKELRVAGKKEEDLLALEDQINAFEMEIEKHGMGIRDIALSVVGHADNGLYSMVHYGSKSRG